MLIYASVWITSVIMKSHDVSSNTRARLCISPQRSKRISARSWVMAFLIPLSGFSTSLLGTISLKWKIRLWVCQKPHLKWSSPQERQGNAGQIWQPHGIPLMTWSTPLWYSFPFLGRRNRRYIPCWKIHIGNRHPWISQNLPEAFPSGLHP